MVNRIPPLAVLSLLVLAASTLSDDTPGNAKDRGFPEVVRGEAQITYRQALKDPDKVRGKTVTWECRARGLEGKGLLVVLNWQAPDAEQRRFIVHCASEKEAERLFESNFDRITATLAGNVPLTCNIFDPNVGVREVKEMVPLLVRPRLEPIKGKP